jgi:hypothetical protein
MVALKFYAGYVYPPRHVCVDKFDVAGFALSAEELCDIQRRLPGCPITYEHAGIEEASSRMGMLPTATATIKTLNKCAQESGDMKKCPVGIVQSAFFCADGGLVCCFVINSNAFPRMCTIIDSKLLRGLSLTHFHGNVVVPLEVSLCSAPARPECFVTFFGNSAKDILWYKARRCAARITPVMTTTAPPAAAPAATTMKALLESLQPSERDLIAAALDTFKSKIAEETSKNAELQAQHDALTKANAVDKSMLESQVQAFLGAVGPSTASQFGLEPSTCAQNINSENPEIVRRQIDRMLMCCNYSLTTRAVEKGKLINIDRDDDATLVPNRPAKRKAVDDVTIVEPDADDAGTLLHRALCSI